MNVLNVMLSPSRFGMENAALNYAQALYTLGYNVLNCLHPRSEIKSQFERFGEVIFARYRSLFGPWDPISVYYFRRVLKKYKIDCVFCHQGRYMRLFKPSCKDGLFLIGVNHGIGVRSTMSCDFVIVQNSSKYQSTFEAGLNLDKMALVPNTYWKAQSPQLVSYKRNLCIIGSFGRFANEKGYDILINALAILKDRGIDFKMFLGGSGEMADALYVLRDNLGLQDYIEFVGFVTEEKKEAFFDSIDVFVLPSRNDNCPLVLIEALFYGKAIISTDSLGARDIIQDGKNGMLVQTENPPAIANALEHLIQDEALRETFRLNARQTYLENHTHEIFCKKIQAVMNQTQVLSRL